MWWSQHRHSTSVLIVELSRFFYTLLIMGGAVGSAMCDEDMLKLLKRIEDLEKSDQTNKQENAMLKSAMLEMKMDFEKKLSTEINKLKTELGDNAMDRDEDDRKYTTARMKNNVIQTSVEPDSRENAQEKYDDTAKARRRSLKVRGAVETEVAFYATHSGHDVLHLGQNQIIVFDQTVSNIGNAYNIHHGGFVAPVDGTYVFHVTLMGLLHNSTDRYYSAHIDVDDVSYSRFYIVPYDQSSQMFVIDLKSGSTVSVKNDRIDDGIIGQHYSSFSGFLLYQHFQSGAVIGK